jgi:putative protease
MLGVRSEKDKELSKTAADSQIGKGVRRVGITLCAEIKKDAPMKLSLSLDGATSERLCREITVEAMGDTPLIAENRPTDAQTAKKNLTKFGSTPCVVTECDIKLDDGLMIPISSLNALRREASDKLLSELLAPYEKRLDFDIDFKSIENIKGGLLPNGESESDKQKPQTARKTAYFTRLYQVPVEASDYFDIRFLAATEFVRENAEQIKALKINGIALPPVIYDSEMGEIREMLALASELGVSHALVGNLGHISLIKELGFSLFGDFRLNVSNSETASLLCSRFGFEEVLLSPELTLPRIRTISNYANVGAIVYGRIPLMIVEKCVISELTPCAYAINKKGSPCALCAADKAKLVDRTGAAFPVLREFRHRNVIFNSLPTYMADKLTELPYEDKCSRHFIFSCESSAEVSSIISAYKSNSPSAAPVRRIGV